MPRAALVGLLRLEARSVDVVVGDCGRVPIPVYLAGAKMVAPYLFGPQYGAAANFVLWALSTSFTSGINSDPAAIPDGDTFMPVWKMPSGSCSGRSRSRAGGGRATPWTGTTRESWARAPDTWQGSNGERSTGRRGARP